MIGRKETQRLAHRAPKTVNNVLTVLNVLLKKAVEWDVIERMPCTIRLLPVPKPTASFYDFDEFERLLEATNGDPQGRLVVLVVGDVEVQFGVARRDRL